MNVNKIDSNDGDRSSSKRKRSRSFDGEEKKQEDEDNVHKSPEDLLNTDPKQKKPDTKSTSQAITSPSKNANEKIIPETTTPQEKKKKRKDKKSKKSKKSKRQ